MDVRGEKFSDRCVIFDQKYVFNFDTFFKKRKSRVFKIFTFLYYVNLTRSSSGTINAIFLKKINIRNSRLFENQDFSTKYLEQKLEFLISSISDSRHRAKGGSRALFVRERGRGEESKNFWNSWALFCSSPSRLTSFGGRGEFSEKTFLFEKVLWSATASSSAANFSNFKIDLNQFLENRSQKFSDRKIKFAQLIDFDGFSALLLFLTSF